ncbi:MAG: hypothetical protein II887_00855 [Bacteroidales bacterium]|nr:hypothetical protein [Bacteroidales bacterium]
MKRIVMVGTALVFTALLFFSCNKNRFDFSEMDSIEGSGQWKLPIGKAHVTLGDLMTQLGDNQMVSYDDDGNLQIRYNQTLNNVLKGSSFLNLGSLNFSTTTSFANPFPSIFMEPIDTVFRFNQKIRLTADSAGIETAIVKSGEMILSWSTNLGNVSGVDISSSGIIMPGGGELNKHFNSLYDNSVDLTGATFRLRDPVTGVPDSTMTLSYAIHYQMTGISDPNYEVNVMIWFNQLKLQELSGYVSDFTYDIDYDTAFSLPLNNIEGQATLVGTNIKINERNTFGNLYASLQVNKAELYGGGAPPYAIFGNDPYVIEVIPSEEFVNVMPEEPINLHFDSRFDAIRVNAEMDFNPNNADRLVTIREDSSLDLELEAYVPMKFNIPGVYYTDTLELSMSDISAPDLVEEIRLSILFDSEMPFNLEGQLYTLSNFTGHVTDSLLSAPIHIDGSFDGSPKKTDAVISITRDRLKHLLAADKLIMQFGVNTNGGDVMLNLDNGIGLTLKADVIYGGTVDLNQ